MGVPKFFRWMSERYPAISQLIAENRIPEFDNLYLDMNGIIHNCTHNDSDSITHRMSEEQMFIAIFNYIEHLFGKIKPQKLFFMAIDGVAPRAKMNQQRARRFRTALDAEKAREKAIQEGIEMPKEDAFDSNCITPGTQFMARLTKHLKYFVSKKVSEDVEWQGVEIVLSGHEVPGEGEHKIMEYIRQAKAQPDYDPNRRHCLYGLDADLIMLGLLSHDPHFCLLREEVVFGRSKGKSKELEHQNFYLMHLCIVREYLELEFQELKEPGILNFPFDMERVIDDFILMAFFVGNDFLPNLPHLHINEGALALMFNVYKTTLPKAKGYINEGGVINMERLALLLDELSHVEFRFFESENADAAWFKGKRMEREDVMEKTKRKGQLVITTDQSKIFNKVGKWVTSKPKSGEAPPYDLPVSLPARDRKFVEELADSLNVQWQSVQNDEGNRHMRLSFPPALDFGDDDSEEEEEDPEAQLALNRVIKRYQNAKIVDMNADEAQAAMDKKYDEKFKAWKSKHYEDKFGWGLENEAELTKLAENYVQGLQWVLYYYYQGVASWPWYYQYHYSPFISDVKKGLKADINFKLGQPFRPFQQLMGVLPDRSKSIVPTAYWPLMTDPNSPIIDFYPRDFELDMNGKKQEWEAVVKIPFIDEDRLLKAMATKDHLLSEDELHRNSFGASLKFTYQQNVDFIYPSSLPGFFPELEHCHCVENIYELPVMDGLEYFIGLMSGAQTGTEALAGFPSLKTLPFSGHLDFHGVNIFQSDSRNESMVVTLSDSETRATPKVAKSKLGKAVYVGYPFLQEAKIVRVSDELFSYVLAQDGSGRVDQFEHDPRGIENFKRKADRIESTYSKKLGMVIGSVEALVHVDMLKGLKKTDDGATIKEYGEIPGTETDYAPQIIVDEVHSQDQRFIEKASVPVEEEFPLGAKAFFLGDYAYGRPCEVIGHENGKMNLWVSVLAKKEPDFGLLAVRNADQAVNWTPSYAVARQLQMNPLALSKITSSLTVESSGLKLNLGLNLKFEAKGLKVLGYSRKGQTGWEYSPKAIDLLVQYMTRFPEFIAGISMNPKGNIYEDTMFYDEKIAKTKVKEIGAWLKSIESKGFEKVPLDAEQLDSDAVGAIQQLAEQNMATSQAVPRVVKSVPRNALLNPPDAETRISGQRFSLGDRVVYVLSSGRVPIAQRGTVVGLTRTSRQTLLDIVFDSSFMSGTSLGQRCQPFFGSTVPSDSVLNITHKQFVAGSQASKAKAPVQHSQPLGQRGYGAPNGAGQLRPAGPPQQPAWTSREHAGGYGNQDEQNGFGQQKLPYHKGPPSGHGRAGYANVNITNGAQAGFAPRGGRGGGSAPFRGQGRGAFRHPGTQNGGQPAQQSYNAVPPPANINAPRGNRGGRGGARGRGRGGRGGGDSVAAAQPT